MNLATTYMGLELRNPLVAGAGPLSQTVKGIKALADGGAAAVVLYSVFEEQIRRQNDIDAALEQAHAESFGEALSFFPELPEVDDGNVPATYLHLVEKGAAAVEVPVIGSINGSTRGGWTQYARQLEDAGAAAIELNIYLVAGDISLTGRQVEQRHVEILQAVKQAVSVPVAVKLSPYFSSVGHMCKQLSDAGADALVLFNRFLQPEIDIDAMDIEPEVTLSTQIEGRLPRTWIAALHGRVSASLAATSGVRGSDDVVRFLLSGADVVMTTSALIRHGAEYSRQMLDGLEEWMTQKGYTSLDDIRGLLATRHKDENAYQRAAYLTGLEEAKTTYSY